MDRLAQPAAVVAAHLSEWGDAPPHVELAVFGTREPRAIVAAVDALCRDALGAEVQRYRFHQSSVGSVHGVELSDGRCVVVKAHQPSRPVEALREQVRVQSHLAARGLFAPPVLAGPLPLAHGHATVEPLVEHGAPADGHDPAVRAELARALTAIVAACAPLANTTTLPGHLLATPPAGALWPTPHSKLFDFAASSRGAEWIDALASAARAAAAFDQVGRVVIGHGDWRVEHVRFGADGRAAVAFDWDSLCRVREPALVGFTAHAFCADWSVEGRAPAPSLDEARAFVAAYETARGGAFGRDERAAAGAAFAYSCAYTARCGYALGSDERAAAGTFMHLCWHEREALLAL